MSNKNEYYKAPKPGVITRFFWGASGADPYILERSTYSDHVKYACLGGIVVATGAMAALAGGYAFYTIFQPKGDVLADVISWSTTIKATIFGIIWGLIIFNIDRFIVTSTGKGDGTEAITMQELKSAIPRIIMGIIIAITISKPVEIRMFKSEIDIQLRTEQQQVEKNYKLKTRENFEEQFKDLEKEENSISLIVNDYIKKINTKDSLYNIETSQGQGGRIKGEGSVALALKAERTRLENMKNDYIAANQKRIDDISKRRTKLASEQEIELNQDKRQSAGLDGLLERIKLAHKIAGFWISTFITLLFMAVELTPIFFKLMLIKSPYDYLEDNYKEIIKAEQGIEVLYEYYKDKVGIERNYIQYHQAEQLLLDKKALTEAQKELTNAIVNEWIQREKNEVKNNLDNYIMTANDSPSKEDS